MTRILIVGLCIMMLSACTSPIRSMSKERLLSSKAAYTNAYNEELELASSKSRTRLSAEYQNPEEQTYDILMLSGGGELGAFGAGFLKGWGNVQQKEFLRPSFDSVSGISTGALIAPFAFIGSEDAYNEIVDLYRNPDDALVVPRTIVSFILGQGAYYDATVLHERIRKSISEQVVTELAKGAKQNRVLLVGATNLDYGVMRVWDLAEMAAKLPILEAEREITKRLIASSAIPSAFPPVTINDYLYVDGGASMQVVSGIDDRSWLYSDLDSGIGSDNLSNPIKIRIWMIINNKLVMEPELVKKSWASIATRSLISLMRGSTLQTIQDVETFANLINKREDFDVKMHYVAIPQDYKILDTPDLFNKEKMRALVELGEKMGADPSTWKTKAIRPGAAIIDQ